MITINNPYSLYDRQFRQSLRRHRALRSIAYLAAGAFAGLAGSAIGAMSAQLGGLFTLLAIAILTAGCWGLHFLLTRH